MAEVETKVKAEAEVEVTKDNQTSVGAGAEVELETTEEFFSALIEYETVFIIEPTKSEDEMTVLVDKIKGLIQANGTMNGVDNWGKRRLAYPINHFNEGYYVVIRFSAGPSCPKELSRIFRITDGIIRGVVVKKNK